MDLEDVWEFREQQLYPSLFGPGGRGIFPLTRQLFADRFKVTSIDMMWEFFGVFEFAPTETRNSWLYVTSGLSNPWEDDASEFNPKTPSGYGAEFYLNVTEQGDWAIQTLQNMLALFLVLNDGLIPNGAPYKLHDRVPLNGPINGKPECQIRHLLLEKAVGVPEGFELPSGDAIFAGFSGITDAEQQFAKANGSAPLSDLLRAAGALQITDPHRASITLPGA